MTSGGRRDGWLATTRRRVSELFRRSDDGNGNSGHAIGALSSRAMPEEMWRRFVHADSYSSIDSLIDWFRFSRCRLSIVRRRTFRSQGGSHSWRARTTRTKTVRIRNVSVSPIIHYVRWQKTIENFPWLMLISHFWKSPKIYSTKNVCNCIVLLCQTRFVWFLPIALLNFSSSDSFYLVFFVLSAFYLASVCSFSLFDWFCLRFLANGNVCDQNNHDSEQRKFHFFPVCFKFCLPICWRTTSPLGATIPTYRLVFNTKQQNAKLISSIHFQLSCFATHKTTQTPKVSWVIFSIHTLANSLIAKLHIHTSSFESESGKSLIG